jgi:hypothetical protein
VCDVLLELLAWQQKQIDSVGAEQLEQETLKLKGETTKPEVKPSKMDKDTAGDDSGSSKQNKGPKRSKTGHIKNNATVESSPTKSRKIQPLRVIGKWSFRTSCLKRPTPAIAWPNTKHRMAAMFQGNSPMVLTAVTRQRLEQIYYEPCSASTLYTEIVLD